MSNARRIHQSLRWVIGSAWMGLAGVSDAAEPVKKSPAGAEAAMSPGVAATQRELERIRAATDPRLSGLANSSAPRVAVPELRTDSVESPLPSAPAPTAVRGAQSEKGTGNWLVDAMEQGARDRDERQRAALGLPRREERPGGGGRDAENRPEGAPFASGTSITREDRKAANEERERAAAVNREPRAEKRSSAENPLANYLGDWLRPQDYALLAPSLSTGATSPLGTGYNEKGAPVGMSDVTRDLGRTPILKPAVPGGFAPATAPLMAGAATTAENPFLAGLNPIPKSSPVAIAPPPVALAQPPESSRPVSPVQASEAAPVAPKIPDLAKPRPDETYFKQLKRF